MRASFVAFITESNFISSSRTTVVAAIVYVYISMSTLTISTAFTGAHDIR